MSEDFSKKGDSPSKKYPWGIPAGFIVTLVAVWVMQPIAAVVVSLYPMIMGWGSSQTEAWLLHSPIASFAVIVLFEALSVGWIAAFVASKRASFWVATALKRLRWRDLAYAGTGFVAYFALATVALIVLPILLPIDMDKDQFIGFEPGSGGLSLILAFLGLVILPPLAEEIVFRGFLYGTLRSKVSMLWATVITSLVFAALHLLGSASGGLLWVAFADTFILSLVLCYVRDKTSSLWASVIIHALKNGLVFVNLFVINAR